MSTLLRAFLLLVSGALLAWWGLSGEDAETIALRQEVAGLQEQVTRQELQLDMLRARHRVATLEVLDQYPDPSAHGGRSTRFRFQEVDDAAQPLGPSQEFTIEGSLLYVDAQVIKFDDAFVEEQDLLRGSSLLLFRRLFGEYQSPADGFPIDAVGQRPSAYDAEGGSPAFQRDLWEHFWEYANRPAVSRASGVRAMHGEAPYIKLQSGKRYTVDLRQSGGLSIRVID